MVFVNRYYFPDQSATSRVLTAIAVRLAKRGYSVSVLTSNQRYEDANARLAPSENCDGVQVRRLHTSRFGRQRLAGRALDYLAFIVGAGWWLLLNIRRGDVVVCKTDPPMLSAFLWPVLALRRGVLVNWLQDLFPEVAIELAVVSRRVSTLARWMRNAGLKAAKKNVVIGQKMAEKVAKLGIPVENQCLIENACDVAALSQHEGGLTQRLAWGVDPAAMVVMYSGNFGRAHPHRPVAQVIKQLRSHADICFVFIGGGAGMALLREHCEALPNCCFLPYQPDSQLAESLAAGDIHLVALQPQLEGLIVPSKFYPIAAVGRPVIYLGAVDSDVGHYLKANDCGHVVSTADELKDIIASLAVDRHKLITMGSNAQALAQQQFSVDHACDKWECLLKELNLYPSQPGVAL